MSSLRLPRQSAITVVIVIAVIVPMLGASTALPPRENVTPENDTWAHGNSINCSFVTQPTLNGTTGTATERATGSSAQNATQSVEPCYDTHRTANETGNKASATLGRVTNTTVGILNRTVRDATNTVKTARHGVVGLIDGTVDRVVDSTNRTAVPGNTTLPESDVEPIVATEETATTPAERRTPATEADR